MDDRRSLNANPQRQGMRYFLGGVAFGLLFPIAATVIRAVQNPQRTGFQEILDIHTSDPLIQIIDTAPLILGAFAFFIGRAQAKALLAQRSRREEAEAFTQQLQAQNQDLKELNEVLDGLIYTASHDLKTPVVNLKSMITMVRMIKDRPDQKHKLEEVLSRMDLAANRFDDTIQDLLDVSRIDDLFEGEHTFVSLKQSVGKVIQELDSQIKSHSAKISLEIEDETRLFIPEESLICIIQNLLSNSIKYRAPERQPEITVSSVRSGNQVCLEVRDNGRGIDLEQHGDKLFKMFRRIEKSDNAGIGLYLVRRIVDKAGGRIEVESTPGVGTNILLYFPVKIAS